MTGTELRVQASLWKRCQVRERHFHGQVSRAVVGAPGGTHWWHTWAHDADLALLVMEGEAADRARGGTALADALYWAVLTRGLALATDLDHLDLRPRPGWHALFDAGSVTVEWPHTRPLLHAVPVDLPAGWLAAATALRLVVVVAGYGLGLDAERDPVGDHLADRLTRAAHVGALAVGAVAVTGRAADQPS
ncbi:hypothetical protein [Actinophytocola sp.]|uniref:hypothetical protein n=1 Tax=Actinophytocola sp. TaxID=1872138 RepID=UPI003899AEAE